MINRRKILKATAYAMLLCFTSLTGAQPLFAAPPNITLPQIAVNGKDPNVEITQNAAGSVMDIHQTTQTAVNQWNSFSIGADSTVNFTGTHKGFNSFNYVKNGGPISEIYGQLNAYNGGNIFIANPAGVQIGNSAQINVGSLYVTNKELTDEQLDIIRGKTSAYDGDNSISSYIAGIAPNTNPAAELMSLGSITSATNVTFDGGRIVLDVDRFFTEEDGGGKVQMTPEQLKGTDSEAGSLTIKTNDKDNVVLGYTGYVENEQGGANYSKKNTFNDFKVTVTGVGEDGKVTEAQDTIEHGYMWVEDLDQLQKIADADNLNGWYALRNSIDANYTASDSYNSGFDNGTTGLGFKPIGTYSQRGQAEVYNYDNAFKGRFDGLGYSIFGLNIRRDSEDGVGLFGAVHGDTAVVRNLTLNDGEITGNNNVGSVAGLAVGGARIEKITNTADVTGSANVGGIAGQLTSSNNSETTTVTDLVNIGTVIGHKNVGGIIGYAEGIDLKGTVYNLGGVAGKDDGQTDSNKIGGLIGEAYNSTIGDGTNLIYNRAGVTGGYDVGGIAGYVHGYRNTITNAANYGDVTATGFTETDYQYHTLVNDDSALPNDATTGDPDNEGNVLATVEGVRAANAGGIAGRSDGKKDDVGKLVTLKISNVSNYGDVTTLTEKGDDNGKQYSYHIAGNVGGIVGRATNTEISNAENSENKISGAHNVGGVAGYMDGESKVSGSGNDGGEITATGARDGNGFVQEWVSNQDGAEEKFKVGNAGGIVGYLFGAEAKITNSGNRGKVHSEPIGDYVSPAAQAANVGGVAGKVDVTDTVEIESIKEDDEHYTETGTISNSYNTGEVRGYTGVGGIAGQMYKGSVVASYNLGTVQTTRTAGGGKQDKDPLNMGGIVGDTSTIADGEGTAIYDVYNAGQIGDETFNYYGRHVGGVVGRLSGDIEKAYNTGEIYNGYSVVGGIAGWWVGGNIKNVFNTGNITVLNKDKSNYASEVGGIVGAYGGSGNMLSYAYNLGTLRSIKLAAGDGTSGTATALGGIVGRIRGKGLEIDNVYTTNNIYSAMQANDNIVRKDSTDKNGLGAIYGLIDDEKGDQPKISNSYFVKMYDDEAFEFGDNIDLNGLDAEGSIIDRETKAKVESSYGSFNFIKDADNADDSSWRIYDGKTLPILNAFTPKMAETANVWNAGNKYNVQYGTAANPLLTIINANGDVTLDWDSLNISGAGSIAVYGDNSSLTINGFNVELGSHYNGTLYSDGTLTINAAGGGDGALYNLGSGSRLYGSSVTFDAQGEAGTADDKDAGLYGKITATNGGVDIKGKNVTVLGELTSSASDTTITGIAGTLDTNAMDFSEESLNNLDAPVSTVGDAYATKVTNDTAVEDRSINIEASGVAEVLFGSMGGGKITSGGDLSVTGDQGIFVDSDFHIGKNMTLTSRVENDDGTVTGGEVVLDLSNMGKTSSGESESDVEHMHKYFLDHFKKNEDGQSAGKITVDVANDEDFIIGLDMWDESKDTFDFTKYDVKNQGDDHTLYEDIENLNLTIKVNGEEGEHSSYRNHVFTWIESAAHLKAVQGAGEKALSYNFALKDDIDASQLTGYKPIAANDGKEYNGIFDGRGFRIIGLNANLHDDGMERGEINAHSRAGIFGTIGENGKVRDLSVYTSKFTGKAAAGAIAGVNKGEIKDVITFGNEVKVLGTQEAVKVAAGKNDTATGDISISAAGGVAGVNLGAITGSDRTDAGLGSTHASDTVIAGGSTDTIFSAAGGVAGVNVREDKETVEGKGLIEKVSSTSAVRSDNIDKDGATKTHGLGGVAGINDGRITDAEAHGTTNTLFDLRSDDKAWDANVGGVAGVNYGALDGVYNESAVAGKTNVGGVVGKNEIRDETRATIKNAVNAGPVFSRGGDEATNAGGIAGANYGEITGGRNTDEITGNKNVGGVVGLNALGALLQNISNAIAAEIRGNDAVGGIAGSNAGEMTSDYNLVNEGLIEGNTNVGGVAGVNEAGGEIISTIAPDGEDDIVINSGSITGVKNVGGIAGTNKGTIKGRVEEGTARSANLGSISGNKNVGGIAGVNEEGATIENTNTDVTLTATGDNPTNFGGVAGVNKGKITNATNRGTVTAYGAKNVGGIVGFNEESGLLDGAGNKGIVIGGSHVAGVAGVNESTNPRGRIENSGTVIATNGGAAGIIYENTANLGGEGKTLELVNRGTVVGFATDKNHGTGGLIGVNRGNIANASLISTTTSSVTGGWNTGGLIGYNTGKITGGRALAENGLGYYAYKIYNNGEVTGTQNVGGLIGNNAADGKLTAGYNTGRVTGMKHDALEVTKDNITLPEGTELPKDVEISWPLTDTLEGGGEGENVGGIAGTNAGLLDQIFNFVMMKDKNDKVSGVSNTGGVVGSNEQGGEVTNAYNATTVEATDTNGISGGVAGTNDGTIENVYATNTDGKLIGDGTAATNGYSFSSGDGSATVLTGGEQKQAASYDGFDFTGTDDKKAVWKIYEGYGEPLLKAFLTEAKYDGETGLMQTGGPLGLPISGVTAGDGLDAYRADNSLLVALKNAGVGDGYLAFASKQIGWSDSNGGFNPNWLGYDIDVTYDITPNPALLLVQNNGHLHWLHRGGERHRSFRERKAEIFFHEGGMVHE